MTDLHVREPDEGDWDMEVVEFVEEGRVVGIAYLDDLEMFAEFPTDDDGEPWAFDVNDLQRALDTARAMLSPDGTDALVDAPDLGGDHPVDLLAGEFDASAARRGSEDEGFYPVTVALSALRRAAELDLAVVALEAFTLDEVGLDPIGGSAIDVGDVHAGEPWAAFKAGCNLQAGTLLERWLGQATTVVSIEVADRDGDRFVL
ncbi:MAG TPA: hypothetical protein VMM81_07450 [Acidimicrobiia bacterium]|nr:hypothetical protein [Acidimicrobiia bacterium]